MVSVTTENLGLRQVLGDPVEVVDHCHAAPAHPKSGMHVCLGPLKNLGNLIPIGHIVEIQNETLGRP